jgi:hypothetical protein
MKSGVGSTGEAEGASPLIYLSEAPLCQIQYADAIEEEGNFEHAPSAWAEAERDWTDFGSRDIPVSSDRKLRIRLADYEFHTEEMEQKLAQLKELAPEAEKQVEAEKRALLTKDQLETLEKKPQTPQERYLQEEILSRLKAEPLEIAARAPPENRREAIRLATEVMRKREVREEIDTSRNIVNYGYWLMRCQAEQLPEAIAARKLLYEARQAQLEVELEKARQRYEEGFAAWRQVLDKFPKLLDDSVTGADIVEAAQRYRRCLKELDEEFPRDFILAELLKLHEPPSPVAATPPAEEASE